MNGYDECVEGCRRKFSGLSSVHGRTGNCANGDCSDRVQVPSSLHARRWNTEDLPTPQNLDPRHKSYKSFMRAEEDRQAAEVEKAPLRPVYTVTSPSGSPLGPKYDQHSMITGRSSQFGVPRTVGPFNVQQDVVNYEEAEDQVDDDILNAQNGDPMALRRLPRDLRSEELDKELALLNVPKSGLGGRHPTFTDSVKLGRHRRSFRDQSAITNLSEQVENIRGAVSRRDPSAVSGRELATTARRALATTAKRDLDALTTTTRAMRPSTDRERKCERIREKLRISIDILDNFVDIDCKGYSFDAIKEVVSNTAYDLNELSKTI